MLVASNTSPISNLAVIGRLSLLRSQFREIWIPRAVQSELHQLSDPAALKEIQQALHDGWIKPRALREDHVVRLLAAGARRALSESSKNAFGPGLPWCACDRFRPVRALAGAPPASIGYER
jgi:predicted nucleic acid-binding protein